MSRKKKHETFVQRLIGLISEPYFIRFEHIITEPNFFRIVGRSHYERWHSAFWGWLLDSNGSHLLDDYALRRLLFLLMDGRCLKAAGHEANRFWQILPTLEFSNIEVAPNENSPTETSVAGVGRFDIFLRATFSDVYGGSGRLNIVVELKIDSSADFFQSKKYPDWLLTSYPDEVNLLVYMLPSMKDSSRNTTGDERWYCVDYQLLSDKLLHPMLDHPSLNDRVKPFLIQYLNNLRIRYKGVKMAITEDEKRMAVALYERYNDVFDSIYDALVATGVIDYSTSDIAVERGRESGRLAIKIDGKVLAANTVRTLFFDVLKYLVDNELLTRLPLPWGTSNKRYILTNEMPPVHPNGRSFFYPMSYNSYTIETHYARDRGLQVLASLCNRLEIDFEYLDT